LHAFSRELLFLKNLAAYWTKILVLTVGNHHQMKGADFGIFAYSNSKAVGP
jgi:hypothetical protein